MKNVFVTGLALICLFVAVQAAQAQCGGKAEPGRISFKQGTHSSTLKGRLKGDEQAEYVFGANSGQALTIDVTSVPANAIAVEVRTPGGENFALQSDGTKWNGTLPETGDYFMVLKIAPGAGPNRVSYVFNLTIE